MTGYHNNSDKHDILNQILNDIATEEIPDDMSLWTDIRDDLEQKPSRPMRGNAHLNPTCRYGVDRNS